MGARERSASRRSQFLSRFFKRKSKTEEETNDAESAECGKNISPDCKSGIVKRGFRSTSAHAEIASPVDDMI